MTLYRLVKLADKYYRNLTPYEIEKCIKDTIKFDRDNFITKALDFSIKFKEERKIKNKLVEYNLQYHAQKGSGFDTWIIMNNVPCDKHIVHNIKTRRGIVELKVFNGYIQNNAKQTPQYLHFRCGMTHLNYSLNKLGKTFKLQKEILKTELNHDENFADFWRDNRNEWLPYVEKTIYVLLFSMHDIVKQRKKLLDLV